MSEDSTFLWIKASASVAVGACVELASSGDTILLRDSKDPSVHLRFSRTEIVAFLDGAKKDEFDHLTRGSRADA